MSNENEWDYLQSRSMELQANNKLTTEYFSTNEVFDQDSKQLIERNAVNIVNYISRQNKFDLLVFGNVQSGKTINIIATSLTAIENYFDLVILLGGTNNTLLDQTYQRVSKFLSTKDEYQILKLDDYNDSMLMNLLSIKQKTILVVLKANDQIKRMANLLTSRDYWPNKKVLLIDDESDYVSIPSNQTIKNFSNISSIIEFYNSHENYSPLKLLQFTATPFANIKYHEQGLTKLEAMYVMYEPSSYFGISEFNEQNDSGILTYATNFSELTMSNGGINFIPILVDHFVRLVCFLIENPKSLTTFVINIDSKTDSHENTQILIQSKLRQVKDMVNSSIDFSSFINNESNMALSEILDANSISPEEARLKIKSLIDSTQIEILNQNSNNIENAKLNNNHLIIIGGSLISRGYTFDNLLTIVLDNVAKENSAADVLFQKSRWLGYRKSIIKFQKIFVREYIKQHFYKMADLINIIHNETTIGRVIDIEQIRNSLLRWESLQNGVPKLVLTNRKAKDGK